MINYIIFIAIAVTLALLGKNVTELTLDHREDNILERRLTKLKIEKKRDGDAYGTVEAIDSLTKPFQTFFFPLLSGLIPSLKLSKLEDLKRDLAFVGWDDTFTPESFIASALIMRIVGIILVFFSLFALKDTGRNMGTIVGILFIIGLDKWLKSEVKSLKEELFGEFPEFIRIVSGYLSANIEFSRAIALSIKYVSGAWKPILTAFISKIEVENVGAGLDYLKESIDMFEVREFASIVKLTLEQGASAKEGFLLQADKIAEMQRNQLILKIGKRKTMAILIQLPILIISISVLALPIFIQAMNFMG